MIKPDTIDSKVDSGHLNVGEGGTGGNLKADPLKSRELRRVPLTGAACSDAGKQEDGTITPSPLASPKEKARNEDNEQKSSKDQATKAQALKPIPA